GEIESLMEQARSRGDAAGDTRAENQETTVMPRATGPFDVSLKPLPMDSEPGSESLGRMSIEKQFRGDLEGTSEGQMLSGGTAIKNSAAYVAIERVSGSLKGRKGSFILQHT